MNFCPAPEYNLETAGGRATSPRPYRWYGAFSRLPNWPKPIRKTGSSAQTTQACTDRLESCQLDRAESVPVACKQPKLPLCAGDSQRRPGGLPFKEGRSTGSFSRPELSLLPLSSAPKSFKRGRDRQSGGLMGENACWRRYLEAGSFIFRFASSRRRTRSRGCAHQFGGSNERSPHLCRCAAVAPHKIRSSEEDVHSRLAASPAEHPPFVPGTPKRTIPIRLPFPWRNTTQSTPAPPKKHPCRNRRVSPLPALYNHFLPKEEMGKALWRPALVIYLGLLESLRRETFAARDRRRSGCGSISHLAHPPSEEEFRDGWWLFRRNDSHPCNAASPKKNCTVRIVVFPPGDRIGIRQMHCRSSKRRLSIAVPTPEGERLAAVNLRPVKDQNLLFQFSEENRSIRNRSITSWPSLHNDSAYPIIASTGFMLLTEVAGAKLVGALIEWFKPLLMKDGQRVNHCSRRPT